VLDVLAALVAVALLAVVQEGAAGPPRILLVLAFTFFVPGRAIITNYPRMARWSDLGASIVVSLGVLAFLATVTLWAHFWHPLGLFQVEAVLCLAGLVVGIVRRRRNS
jgi:peptidoglycan/LPS O-acetylase OafA/YrhL